MTYTYDVSEVFKALAEGEPLDLPRSDTHFLRRLVLEPVLNRSETKAHGKRFNVEAVFLPWPERRGKAAGRSRVPTSPNRSSGSEGPRSSGGPSRL